MAPSMSSDLSYSDLLRPFLNNNTGYEKIKVANGIQQRRYISCSWSGVCVFWQFCKVLKDLSNSRQKSNKTIIFLIFIHAF